MKKPITTLFMLGSVDGKISTGRNDTLDVDKELSLIKALALTKVKKLKNSYLYLQYDLVNDTNIK